jgi:hypothetical protein
MIWWIFITLREAMIFPYVGFISEMFCVITTVPMFPFIKAGDVYIYAYIVRYVIQKISGAHWVEASALYFLILL